MSLRLQPKLLLTLLLSAGGMAALGYWLSGGGALSSIVAAWFGPPRVTMTESYEAISDGPSFDHALFDGLLRRHVDADGWVDYAALRGEQRTLDEYLAALAAAPFDALGRDEKLALLLNAYNAFTLRLILDRWPLDSIMDIAAEQRWAERRWTLGGRVLSLDDIEHAEIRPHFREPRIHFALVCAAIGCPKLRNEAYVASRLNAQLEEQMRYSHAHERWFRFDAAAGKVHVSMLYDWYREDFLTAEPSVVDFVARYSAPLRSALVAGAKPTLEFLPYDWALNDRGNRP